MRAPAKPTMDSGLQRLTLRIFEGLSGSYDRVLDLATLMQDRYWKSWLLENAGIRRGMRVLDLGCGTGVLEERLANSGSAVVGVDLTEEMVRLAQTKDPRFADSLSVGDAENLPFRDGSFDLVVSCYVVKYCSQERLASEVMRVLRPGGSFYMYDFSRPRGFFAPFHAFYAYGVLRVIGVLLKPVDPGLAFTYEALPSVIRERPWDDSFGSLLEGRGFSAIGSRRLSGGVITAFWATK
jgi:demethylmenaquinone methyltransferase/2-methoxy-6-polyprenyl-1,4-benzoquinol methylase